MQFVPIEPGTFQMGSNGVYQKDNKPIHTVTITRPFWMGKYEVTQTEFRAVGAARAANWPESIPWRPT